MFTLCFYHQYSLNIFHFLAAAQKIARLPEKNYFARLWGAGVLFLFTFTFLLFCWGVWAWDGNGNNPSGNPMGMALILKLGNRKKNEWELTAWEWE